MRRAERVAVLADVHGNATELEAVLAEVEAAGPDLLVQCGDLTWGPQPLETLALLDGAHWALLGPGVEHRRTPYDVDRAVAASRTTIDPLAEEMVEILRSPATPAEAIERAERVVFSG